MSKNSRFRRPFEKQHGKPSESLLKSARKHLYYSRQLLQGKLSWKKSLLVICKILGLFVNTLTTGEKYSLLIRDNLTQSIQMQLSKN